MMEKSNIPARPRPCRDIAFYGFVCHFLFLPESLALNMPRRQVGVGNILGDGLSAILSWGDACVTQEIAVEIHLIAKMEVVGYAFDS